MNRNKIKQWFITFPQCGAWEKKEFFEILPPCDEAFIVKETHENGGYHLHSSIKLIKGLSKAQFIKWFTAKLPNDYKRIDLKATMNLIKAETYLKKEDPEPFEFKGVINKYIFSEKEKDARRRLEQEWIKLTIKEKREEIAFRNQLLEGINKDWEIRRDKARIEILQEEIEKLQNVIL